MRGLDGGLNRVLLLCLAAGSQMAMADKPASHSAKTPPTVKSEYTGIDESNLDRSVNPCDDFYQFACGGWLKKTEIPADRSRWGSFSEIDERNLALLRKALESDAEGKGNAADPYREKLGDFYSACMDEAAIEKTAASDLQSVLAPIEGVKTIGDLEKQMAKIYLTVANPVFSLEQQQDFKDATKVIASLDQGGIGLPDRDFYTEEKGKFPEQRKQYAAHVTKMFELAGEPADKAAADAKTVIAVETELAKGSLTRVERRDPDKVYHRINLAGIVEAAPRFPWKTYFSDVGHPGITEINVTHPAFFKTVDGMLEKVTIPDWKTYLRWHVIHGAAPSLSKKFVDENFHFYGQLLNGQKELPPRWKRCVQASDRALGEALAQTFIRETFGPDAKAATLTAVHDIEASMQRDLKDLSWMDEKTRAEAMDKLHSIANKIGYPDKWRNYEALKITRDSFLKNNMAAGAFETHRQLDKIGKPLDRNEWEMTPQTVNAYYNPSMNEMVFPAGILQVPFYDKAARPSVNYGAIGMVMGHELTHGFDDEGRKFDGKGNRRDWWQPAVGKEFDRRAECVVKQFDGYVAVDDLHLNGKLTLGENIADLGGLKLAYRALAAAKERQPKAMREKKPTGKNAGFTDEQLFFLGTAQAWCSKTRPENARMRVTLDPHSPPEYRINGPLSNLPEFGAAWQCKPGSKMIRAEQCVIW